MKDDMDKVIPFEKKETETSEGAELHMSLLYQKIETTIVELQDEIKILEAAVDGQTQFLKNLEKGAEDLDTVSKKFRGAFDVLRELDAQMVRSVNASHDHFVNTLGKDLQETLIQSLLSGLEKEIEASTSLFKRLRQEHFKRVVIFMVGLATGVCLMGGVFYFYVEKKMEPFFSSYYQKRYFLGDALMKNWESLTEKEKAILMKKIEK